MNSVINWINSLGIPFVAFNLVMLLQSSILILILLLLDRVLRKRVRAVLRYWIWLLVLVKLVLPTNLSLPTSPSYWLTPDVAGIVSQQFSDWDTSQQASPGFGLGDLTSGLALSAEPAFPRAMPGVARPIPVSHIEAVPGSNGEIPAFLASELIPRVQALAPLQWQGGVFLIWLAVTTLALAFLLKRWLQVTKLISGSQEPDQSLVALLEQCRQKLGVRTCIRLRILPVMGSPSVFGLFRPTILIPRKLLGELDQIQLRSILMHELAHIKRGDLWCSLVQTILQIVYFYNALLWIANYAIRTVREKAVDEMVLVNLGAEADDYPHTLLNISQLAFQRPMFSLRLIGVVESKKELIGRIQHMANRPVPKSARLGLVGTMALAILAATLLPMAKAQTAKPIVDVSREGKAGEDQQDRSQATFTDRDESGRIKQQWGFTEIRSRGGDVLDVSQPYMNFYLDDLTCKITADNARLRQEAGRGRFPQGITFSGNVLIQCIPESDSSYSLEAQTISIDLADNKDSKAVTSVSDLEHMDAYGGVVKLGFYTRARAHVDPPGSVSESQAGEFLVGAELECQSIEYDPDSGQGVFTVTGPGKIRFKNAQAQGAGKLGAQQRPCYAFLDGFETLQFFALENRIVLSSDNRMQFEYFPIVDGQGKQRIYAEAKQVEIELAKTQAGELGLGTLTAAGDIFYEENGKDAKDKLSCTAYSVSYDHRLATLTMRSDVNEPCTINGMPVNGLQYNLKTKDLQTQLGPVVVGPKRFSLGNSVTTEQPPAKPRIVRQRFVPGAVPQSPMESSDSAVWTALHPRREELFLQAWAGIGHSFPVKQKGGPTLFEVALIQGNDERLVVEVRSKGGEQTVELKRDESVSVTVAGVSYKLLYPSCNVSSAENRSTTNKAMLIVTCKAGSVHVPARVVRPGSTPSRILILPHTRLVSSVAPDAESYIQAYVALADESDAQLKCPGTFRFELYENRPGSAEPRGKRTNIWPDLDLTKAEQNNRRWQDFLRAYAFHLDVVPESNQTYILQATFIGIDGKRLSAQASVIHENADQVRRLGHAVGKSPGHKVEKAHDDKLPKDAGNPMKIVFPRPSAERAFLGVKTMLDGWRTGIGSDDQFRIEFATKLIDCNLVGEIASGIVRETHVELILDRERYYERYANSASEFQQLEDCCMLSFDGEYSRRYSPNPEKGNGVIRPGLILNQPVSLAGFRAYFLIEQGHSGDGEPRFERLMLSKNAKIEPSLEIVSGESCHVVTVTNPTYPERYEKLWVAHEKGMYPVMYRAYRDGAVTRETLVETMATVNSRAGDIWYPARIRRFIDARGAGQITERMEVLSYEPDITVDERTFQIEFPQGTRVRDFAGNYDYIAP